MTRINTYDFYGDGPFLNCHQDSRVAAEPGDAGVVGVDPREERRHHAEGEMQGRAGVEAKRAAP